MHSKTKTTEWNCNKVQIRCDFELNKSRSITGRTARCGCKFR